MKYSASTAIAALTVALLPFSASAADVYNSVKDSPSAEAPAASGSVFNWTGFYIQGQAGVANDNHALDLIGSDKEVGDVSILNLDGLSSAGFVGGGRVGVDYARGRFLVGAFGSYNFSNQETELGIYADHGGPTFTAEKQGEWDAGLRLGYIVAPKTLAYALVAYTETSYEINGPEGKIADQDFSGISVGGGVEFAVAQNVFLGVEYSHTFYQDEDWLDNESLKLVDSLDSDKVMATLKFKLNTGTGLID